MTQNERELFYSSMKTPKHISFFNYTRFSYEFLVPFKIPPSVIEKNNGCELIDEFLPYTVVNKQLGALLFYKSLKENIQTGGKVVCMTFDSRNQ